MGCNGPNREKRFGCNLPKDVKIQLYPGNIVVRGHYCVITEGGR